MDECINCQQSLSGGDLTLPWGDGNNNTLMLYVHIVDVRIL